VLLELAAACADADALPEALAARDEAETLSGANVPLPALYVLITDGHIALARSRAAPGEAAAQITRARELLEQARGSAGQGVDTARVLALFDRALQRVADARSA
jgi:hypothetical protein